MAAQGGLEATIDTVEELGSDSFLYCSPKSHEHLTFVARIEGLTTIRAGTTVNLVPDPGSLHLFDTASGARLPD